MDRFLLPENPAELEHTSRSLRAIAHPLRLKILFALEKGEMNVQSITQAVGTSQSNVSKHLTRLRDKGLLTIRRSDNCTLYRVRDDRTLNVVKMLLSIKERRAYPRNSEWSRGRRYMKLIRVDGPM